VDIVTPELIAFVIIMGLAIAALVYANNEPKGPRPA
jgi:hypothetical protein